MFLCWDNDTAIRLLKGMDMKMLTMKFAAGFMTSAAFATTAIAGHAPTAPGYSPDMLPASPQAGMCYARVEIPAQYSTESQRVSVQDGFEDIIVDQAQLVTRQQQIETKEASVRYEVRQPTFRSVSEQVMVRPSYDKLTVTPPKFVTKTSCIDCGPPRLVWKRGNPGKLMSQGYKVHSTADAGAGGRGYSSTTMYGAQGGTQCGSNCEIWCLVEVPGEQVQYNRKVIMEPAKVQRQSVPAKYRSVMKQVVADPGGVREIPVPAQYRSITVEEVTAPAQTRKVSVPAKFADVAKKTLISPERYEWRQVVCNPGTANYSSSASSYSSGASSYSSGATAHSSGSSVSTGTTYGSGYSGSTYGTGYSSGAATTTGTVYSSGSANTVLTPTYNNGVAYGIQDTRVIGTAPTAAQMGRSCADGSTTCYKQNPYESR